MTRNLGLGLMLALFVGCSSAPKTGILAPKCGRTAVNEHDVEKFGFKAVPDKVVVMRVFATWCPYCKEDLDRIGELFKAGTWKPNEIQIFLLAYSNHGEDRASFDEFVSKRLASFGIPREAVQLEYVDKTYTELVQEKTASGRVLFGGWRGVPFGLVFGKDGRLAFRGHFTMSVPVEDAHYAFVTTLAKETCANEKTAQTF